MNLNERLNAFLEKFNTSLAGSNPTWLLAALGAVSGLTAGLVMVGFRLLIEVPQQILTGVDSPHDYERLSYVWRFMLPAAGGLIIGLWFQRLRRSTRQFGVTHVIALLARRDGLLPIKNAIVQFFGAAISLVSGHSVGREGPSIHVGAACSSWLGQRLRIPHHSIRVLVGCGSAGAIAAAFNTPLAGVIFTMEVLLAEYTLASFIPIILAAVCGTAVNRWAFGSEPIFFAPNISLATLAELGYVVLMGVIIGALSAGFIRFLQRCGQLLPRWPIWQRLTLAGILTGIIAIPAPQIMGIGYDTVNSALQNQLGLGLVMLVLVGKLIATSVGIGFGLPGGLIAPTLVIGTLAGAAIGQILTAAGLTETSPALFAMLGMGAMMSATLNAPLAALTALLELTNNPHIIMPGMLAIVAANLTCQQLFATPSAFSLALRAQGPGLDYRATDPIAQFLRRHSVINAMERGVLTLPTRISAQQLTELTENPPRWLLLRSARPKPLAIFAADLIRSSETADLLTDGHLDLQHLPLQRLETATIDATATLLGALRRMNRKQLDCLYVVSAHSGRVLGIITRQAIERSYRNPTS